MSSLNPVFTVERQVGEVLRRHLGMSKAQARERTIELLDLVGIPSPERRVDEYPHQLSGGMRQRVMIAIAIACEPKVLIADEPTTALDVTIQAAVLDVLRELRERLGMAIVLITHDLGVVADIADRVVIMYAGQKVEEAPVAELFAHPQHPYTIGLLGAAPRTADAVLPASGNGNGAGRSSAPARKRRRLVEIPGRVPALHAPPDHCPFAERCPRADDRSRSEVPALETVRPGHLVACFHPGEHHDQEVQPA
jgi:peptide/nickel transport system ATP-binding protein